MMHRLHLRMLREIVHDLQRVLHMTLHPEGQGLQPLEEEEGVERGQGGAGIPQQDGADIRGKSRRAHRVIEGNAVVAGIGIADQGYFPLAFQSNFPPSTITPPMAVPWPPINLVAEWTTISAP